MGKVDSRIENCTWLHITSREPFIITLFLKFTYYAISENKVSVNGGFNFRERRMQNLIFMKDCGKIWRKILGDCQNSRLCSGINRLADKNKKREEAAGACLYTRWQQRTRNYEAEPLFRREREGVSIRPPRHGGEYKVLTPPYKSTNTRSLKTLHKHIPGWSFAHRMSPLLSAQTTCTR